MIQCGDGHPNIGYREPVGLGTQIVIYVAGAMFVIIPARGFINAFSDAGIYELLFGGPIF